MLKFTESTIVAQTTACRELTIADGVFLKAPEGKILFLTVDGIQKNIVPGNYTGNIVLTVADAIHRKGIMMGNPRPFGAAVVARGGKVCAEYSIPAMVKGGTVEDGWIDGAEINAMGDVAGGLDLIDGQWTVKDTTLNLSGYGDCNGKGAGIYAGGEQGMVEISNLTLNSAGVSRCAVITTDGAKVTIRNSHIICRDGGTDQMEAAAADVGGMLGVPWQLGLTGNNRATQVLSHSSAEYINSTIESECWGVLSVDGVTPSKRWEEYTAHLTARNCKVRVTGESGYGAFSIGPCLDTFEDTSFDVPDYGLIQANETASAIYTGCTVNSGRFGIMSYCNQGGSLKIKDSKFHTQKAMFLIKGCYPQIEVERSELHTENGVLIQLMDADDPFYGGTEAFDESVTEKDPEHDVTKVNLRDFKLFGRVDGFQKPTDVQATFRDMNMQGDIYNSITNASGITYFDMDAAPEGGPEGDAQAGDFTPPAGFEPPSGFEPPAGFTPPEGFEPPAGGPPEGLPALDGGGPEIPAFEPSYSTKFPVNLAVYFEGADYTGRISAATAKHAVRECCRENYMHMGEVTNAISPVVNNGVIVTLDGASSWTVTGDGYLSALHLAPGAKLLGAGGKTVVMRIDGTEMPILPGDYSGSIEIGLR